MMKAAVGTARKQRGPRGGGSRLGLEVAGDGGAGRHWQPSPEAAGEAVQVGDGAGSPVWQ